MDLNFGTNGHFDTNRATTNNRPPKHNPFSTKAMGLALSAGSSFGASSMRATSPSLDDPFPTVAMGQAFSSHSHFEASSMSAAAGPPPYSEEEMKGIIATLAKDFGIPDTSTPFVTNTDEFDDSYINYDWP
jgi:hypothetical protein